MDAKPLLSYDSQIEKLDELGIDCGDIDNRKRIRQVLTNNNYFYKLTCYRKNYSKDKNGKYNIKFEALEDIAKLDMQLRYVLLPYCLDIEHSLKTYLIRIVTNKKANGQYCCDGYSDFDKMCQKTSTPANLKDQIFSGVRYEKDGVVRFQDGFEKYYDKTPIWVALDLSSIGKLKYFVNYLCEERPNNDTLKKVKNNINYVSDIRNECAHSRPIIFNLQKESRIQKSVFTNAKGKGFSNKEINILKVAKIFSLIELHRVLCSEGMRKHRNADFEEYLERVNSTISLHEQNDEIKLFFSSLRKILDVFKVS